MKYKHGLVIGKFYPPHAGHHYLIDTAAEQCEQLTVQVQHRRDESISGQLRASWLSERHPNVKVIAIVNNVDEDYADPDVWDQHVEITFNGVSGFPVDAVFASELYVNELAERLQKRQRAERPMWYRDITTEPVLVDIGRNTFPVSGTAVRDHPAAHWDYITPPVRAHFTKRIAILGPESSGTTTLARALAEEYSTVCVPEYGRLFSEAVYPNRHYEWTEDDFIHIATQQQLMEDQLARRAGAVMICDTDALTTGVFHELYMGRRSPPVEDIARQRTYDLYVITDHYGVPYEDDGLRNGETHRPWMFDVMMERVLATGAPWMCPYGSPEDRVRTVTSRIRRMFDVTTRV